MTTPPQLTFQFLGMPFEIEDVPAPEWRPDRRVYVERCGWRWSGTARQNAISNWIKWKQIHADLEPALRAFARNPYMEDLGGKAHNPEGTLTAFLWKLQESLAADRRSLNPLLDFCEHFQKVHLGRGLIIYCGMVLDWIRNPNTRSCDTADGSGLRTTNQP